MKKQSVLQKVFILVSILLFSALLFTYVQAAELTTDAPVLINVTPDRDTGFRLEWEPSAAAAEDLSKVNYTILRSSDGGESFQAVRGRDASYGCFYLDATTDYAGNKIVVGQVYHYKVRESIDGVTMGDSNVISAVAVSSGPSANEFSDADSNAVIAAYLRERLVAREESIQIVYNAPSFPSGLMQTLYEIARGDNESADPETADEGDYLRYTIIPGTVKFSSGIDGTVDSKTSYTLNISLEYYTSAQEEAAVDDEVERILRQFAQEGVTAESPVYDRAKAVYNYLSETVTYNNGKRDDNGNLMITAYDALVRREAQCYGQLMGAYRLLKELGVVTRRVNGTFTVDMDDGTTDTITHGWNIVKLGDVWYHFDATAANTYYHGYGQKQLHTYRYLLVNDSRFNDSHTFDAEYSAAAFTDAHPMSDSSFAYEPETPAAPVITKNGTHSVTLEWQAVEGADGYAVQRGYSAGGTFTTVKDTTDLSFNDTDIMLGNEYHYKILAYRLVNGQKYYSGWSPRRYADLGLPTAPATPAGLTATGGNAQITLSWQAMTDAAYVELYQSLSPNEGFTKVATFTGSTTGSVRSKLLDETTYYYKLRAYNTKNGQKAYGAYSEVASATTLPGLEPPVITVAKNSYNSLTITWTKIDNAQNYELYRSTNASTGFVKLGTYNSETFSKISGSLATGTKYYYKVRAYRVVDGYKLYSAYSDVASGTPTLSAPTTVTVAKNGYNSLKVSWSKVNGASFYQVYRSVKGANDWKLLGVYDENTLSMTSRQLSTGTTYEYRVRCYRWAGGERQFSGWSTVKSGTPTLSAPTGVKAATGTTKGTVTVSWNKADGATYYQVYRSANGTSDWKLLGTYDEDTLSMTSKALGSGQTYYYRVRCYRWSGGERQFSTWSTIVNAVAK